jgi:hypothetical protein
MRDKDPEWRVSAVFTREKVETSISHPEIAVDRRIVYGLELLAGVRSVEAAARRAALAALRSHGKAARQAPSGRRVQHAQEPHEKGTKTEVVKHVPVHPTLAAMLAEWKLGGWAR